MTDDKMAGWHHRFNGHEFYLANCGKMVKPGLP